MAVHPNAARTPDTRLAGTTLRTTVAQREMIDATPRAMRGILIGVALSIGLWAAPAAALWRLLG